MSFSVICMSIESFVRCVLKVRTSDLFADLKRRLCTLDQLSLSIISSHYNTYEDWNGELFEAISVIIFFNAPAVNHNDMHVHPE